MSDQVDNGNVGGTPPAGYTPPAPPEGHQAAQVQPGTPTAAGSTPTSQDLDSRFDQFFNERMKGLYDSGTQALRDRITALENQLQQQGQQPTQQQQTTPPVQPPVQQQQVAPAQPPAQQRQAPPYPEDYSQIDSIVGTFAMPNDAPEVLAITEKSKTVRGEELVAFAKEQARTYFQRTAPPPQGDADARTGVGVGDAAGAAANPLEGITDPNVLFDMHRKQREEGTAE